MKEFESYRQSIIRLINEYEIKLLDKAICDEQQEVTADKIVQDTIKNPDRISELTKTDFEKIHEKLKSQKKVIDDLGEDRKRIEEDY